MTLHGTKSLPINIATSWKLDNIGHQTSYETNEFRTLTIRNNIRIYYFYILLGASCIPKLSIPVNGFLFGRNYTTTVDNQLAKEMLSGGIMKICR